MSPIEYEILIERYLNRKISIRTFYKRFNAAFQVEPLGVEREFYDIIDTLWGILEMYSPSARPEDETVFRITEETVRKESEVILMRLRKYSTGDGAQGLLG